MNFFEIFILNSIYVLFPIMIYLLCYLRYTTLQQKTNDLILDFCLLSSFYLLARFGVLEIGLISILIFNVPLLSAYLNKRDLTILLLSGVIISYYDNLDSCYLLLVLIEYLIYYLIYLKLVKKDNAIGIFITIFIVLKSVIFLILGFNSINLSKIILYLILFWILSFLIIYFLRKGKELMKIRLTFKELEKEKQIRRKQATMMLTSLLLCQDFYTIS